jgi:predicted ATP-grasp superfamily ATP-dependent carboligase
MDLVRPLGLAGIPCAVVARRGAATRFSRFVKARVDWFDAWDQPEELVASLERFAGDQSTTPILYYEEDRELLMISRYRERLARSFRFVIPEAELVEDLVDKARFQSLAERLDLPVPRSKRFRPADDAIPFDLGISYPLIVKPLTRRTDHWSPVAGGHKALQINNERDLRSLWSRLAGADLVVLVQELIPGDESAIESYHVYADERGDILGEFTGKKIRTYPKEFGHSTALVITYAPDVAALGRELVRRMQLRGVAKFDFKRGPDGGLHVLEVNPRFNLWHHLGAVAGVNLPALVYADLAQLPRMPGAQARPGVRWCKPWQDRAAARDNGVPFRRWLPWALTCEAKRLAALDDPMPLLLGGLWHVLDRWPRHSGPAGSPANHNAA